MQALGYDENLCSETDNTVRTNEILNNAELIDASLISKANKPHWLHANLMTYDNDIVSITSSPLYKMLDTYPPGTMLKDKTGHFWVRRARAAVTRHRFITVDDHENYYMQKYLLKVPVTPNDDIITHSPSS